MKAGSLPGEGVIEIAILLADAYRSQTLRG
jgi:hypothetical protein